MNVGAGADVQDHVAETIRSAVDGQDATTSVFFKPFNNSLEFAGISRHKV